LQLHQPDDHALRRFVQPTKPVHDQLPCWNQSAAPLRAIVSWKSKSDFDDAQKSIFQAGGRASRRPLLRRGVPQISA